MDVEAPTRKRTLGEGTYPKGTPYSQNEIFGPLKPEEHYDDEGQVVRPPNPHQRTEILASIPNPDEEPAA